MARPFAASEVVAVRRVAVLDVTGAAIVPSLVLVIWFWGGVGLVFRWCSGWRRIRAAMQDAPLLTHGREFDPLRRMKRTSGVVGPFAIVGSEAAIEPSVFGIVQTLLLWPAGITSRLSDQELDVILLHELSHIRRRDN